MKALVIYDSTGRIWNIVYGEETAPQGLTCMWVDIPGGAQLQSINVTNPNDPRPVFTYLPDSDIGRLQKQVAGLEEENTSLQLALTEQHEENLALQEELTSTQMALVELYEGGGAV